MSEFGEDADDHSIVPGRARTGLRPLPNSMSGLRAFEAVARRKSFTKAGLELHQTQTTISYQISKLEAFLGVSLFIRDRDGVRLSDYGQEYLPAVSSALDILSSSTRRILDSKDERSLSIVSLAAFALKCLLPMMPEFRKKHPDIRINFESVISFNATAIYNHDVSIRYGAGEWPGLNAYKIAEEELFPVCSPEFLAKAKLKNPCDVLQHTAVCTSSTVFRDDWGDWLSRVGCAGGEFADVIVCDTMLSASQAAVDGLGIALSRAPLANNDLRTGRLVEPFNQRISSSTGYYLTMSSDRAERYAVKAFKQWLLEQHMCDRVANPEVDERAARRA